MADFHQPGEITTLHKLNPCGAETLERDLAHFGQSRRISLVLPALYAEFERPAMRQIMDELAQTTFLSRIVIALGRADLQQYRKVRELFADFPVPLTLLWVNDPAVQSVIQMLSRHGHPVEEDGKGRSCWLSYGYLLARQQTDIIALHDCDIAGYSRHMLARLCYPLAHQDLNLAFAKGFYARVNGRLHGRVTRLFIAPLLQAVRTVTGDSGFLNFLENFRYPLAGEFAMSADLARVNHVAGDWGLEISTLAQVYRNCPQQRVCQVELCDTYDHKHQDLCAENPQAGLRRMTCDISRTLFTALQSEGINLNANQLRALETEYLRAAGDYIPRYAAEAAINALPYERRAEELAVTCFARSLHEASAHFLAGLNKSPILPSWESIGITLPGVAEQLADAVDRHSKPHLVRYHEKGAGRFVASQVA